MCIIANTPNMHISQNKFYSHKSTNYKKYNTTSSFNALAKA